MFGGKRLREAQAQIEAYKNLVKTQAEYIANLQTWHDAHIAQVQRQAALRSASVTITMALGRHPGDDLSDNPVLAAATLLLAANRSTQADDALLALAEVLRDPLAEAVDAILG